MLISHPRVMLMNFHGMSSIMGLCSALGLLFPKVFCSSTLTWTIYALLVEVCYNQINVEKGSPGLSMLVGLIGFALYFLCMYTYFRVFLEGGGSPADFAELRIHNLDLLKSNQHPDPITEAEDTPETTKLLHSDGPEEPQKKDSPPIEYVNFHVLKPGVSPYRYCLKCKVWKPDRCHHCSSCNRCVLRMDHHCPWFATCVGFYNQKFFVQHLVYITVYSGYCLLALSIILFDFFKDADYNEGYLSLLLVFLFILALVFFITVGVFSAFLIWLVMRNTSTIEFQERRWNSDDKGKFQYEFSGSSKRKKQNIFDLGWKNNWKSIMGTNWLYWLLPIRFTQKLIHLPLNGVNFVVDEEAYDHFKEQIRLQEQLNHQLQEYRDRR